MCLLFVSISSSPCGDSLRTTFGVGCGDGLVPGREGPGLGSGGSETVHFPAGPQSVFTHQPGGAESLAQMTPKPGDLPKVTAPRVPPGWAAARLRLWSAFALHQDRRGDACGHLEEGRRLAANSDWAGEGWGGGGCWAVGGGGTCRGSPGRLPPGPSLRPPRGLAGGGKAGAGVHTRPSVLKCLQALLPRFPARRQAWVWGNPECPRA